MKKYLSPILFLVVGLSAGIIISHAYFSAPKPQTLTTPKSEPLPAAKVDDPDPDPVAMVQAPNNIIVLPRDPWVAPEPVLKSMPPRQPWKNYAIPMPQPPEQPGIEDWRPDIILPTFPPKYVGKPQELAMDGNLKLIIPTIPPKTLSSVPSDGR